MQFSKGTSKPKCLSVGETAQSCLIALPGLAYFFRLIF